MKRGGWFLVLAVLLVLTALLAGCNAFESIGDDGSREAKLEKAKMAMDDGNFVLAVSILEPLRTSYPNDLEIRRALASAYIGRAGLDFLDLAAKLQEAADNNSISAAAALAAAFPHPVTDDMLDDAARSVAFGLDLALATNEPNDWYRLAIAEIARGTLTLLKGTDLTDEFGAPGSDGVPDTFYDTVAFTDPMTGVVYTSLDNAVLHLGPGYANILNDDILSSVSEVRDGIRGKDGDAGNGATPADVRAYLTEDVSW